MVCSTGVQAEDRITVRIYGQSTWDDDSALRSAIQTAAAIVDETGIGADWVDCRTWPLPQDCSDVRGARDLIVRLTRRFISKAAVAGEAVRVGDADSGLILGVAVVDPATQVGALATIFLEHIQEVASRTGVDRASLLGRVLAHEVGHLLQGKTGHSRTGLMRELWTGEELGLNRHGDWAFDLPEQRDMRAAASRR
jgi:hypothetical protein